MTLSVIKHQVFVSDNPYFLSVPRNRDPKALMRLGFLHLPQLKSKETAYRKVGDSETAPDLR